MTRARKASLGMLAIGVGIAVAGCGGSSGGASSESAPPAAAPATAAETLGVMLGAPSEFTLKPAAASTRAGKVTFTVTNGGKAVHEMVVIALASKSLDAVKAPDGSANEDTAVGEVADIDPGATKSATLQLAPGTYALICNEPGHFAGGMHQILTVS
jgi:uncharacterized cupredoxin-like copper-binding protein